MCGRRRAQRQAAGASPASPIPEYHADSCVVIGKRTRIAQKMISVVPYHILLLSISFEQSLGGGTATWPLSVMEKLFSDSKKIVSASEKSFWGALNVFSTRKNIFLMIQIVFGTIGTPVRAEQKVISASQPLSALELAGGELFPGAKLQLHFAVAEHVDLIIKRTFIVQVCQEF
jgi:hypothetical protein